MGQFNSFKRIANSFVLVHPLAASDEVLAKLFGDNASCARLNIERLRQSIADGERSDDYKFSMRMMDNYDEYFVDSKLSEVLYDIENSKIFHYSNRELKRWSTGQLNILQCWMSIERSVHRDIVAKQKEIERGNLKFATLTIKQLTGQYERLAKLWNDIFDDDVMTLDELRQLTSRVNGYRIYSSDFRDFLIYTNEVLLKGEIDSEALNKIYNYMVGILDTMKHRIDYKVQQESQSQDQ